jgi:hypothetical protein
MVGMGCHFSLAALTGLAGGGEKKAFSTKNTKGTKSKQSGQAKQFKDITKAEVSRKATKAQRRSR